MTPEHLRHRPLPILSDYVCERLPAVATRIVNGTIAATLDDALSELHNIAQNVHATDNPVGVLDLKMLYRLCAMMRPFAATEGQNQLLNDIQDSFSCAIEDSLKERGADNIVHHPAYEDIILNNPVDDVRTYLCGDVGKSEAEFYRRHRQIEDDLSAAIENLTRVRGGGEGTTDEAENALANACAACTDMTVTMRSFISSFDRSHFQTFKPFFDTDLVTCEKGPSGAFSAKIPLIDILIHGKETPPEILAYLEENRKYFPAADMAKVEQVLEMGVLSGDMLTGEGASGIANTMLAFRRAHLGAVHKHIGTENIKGSAEGGGAEKFLQSRIDSFEVLCPFSRNKKLEGVCSHDKAPQRYV